MLDHIEIVTRAHTDLNVFYGIIALLEGGLLSSDSDAAADRIIEACRLAGSQAAARYDRSMAAIAAKIGVSQ